MKISCLSGVITTCLLVSGIFSSVEAALEARLGGQAYYDTVLDITWLADANLAASNNFGVAGINPDGSVKNWGGAIDLVEAMNAADGGSGYLGINDWRLPKTLPVNGVDYNWSISFTGNTDYGWNISAPGSAYPGSTGSEMAYMYYNNLGNKGSRTIQGDDSFCARISPWCLEETGPFLNLQPEKYWSETEQVLGDINVWNFNFSNGMQVSSGKNSWINYFAWPVRDGDVLIPDVSIDVTGGLEQECLAQGGTTIEFTSDVDTFGADIVQISWSLDEAIFSYDESPIQFIGLGEHSIKLEVATNAGVSGSSEVAIIIRDTAPPQIIAAFVDVRTGQEVAQIHAKSKVTPSITVTDTCDPDPVFEALVGIPGENGDQFNIEKARKSISIRSKLDVNTIGLSVTATDASGNAKTENTVLEILQ